MKKLTLLLGLLSFLYANGQETLQTVTTRGNATTEELNLNGGLKVFGGARIQKDGSSQGGIDLFTDWPNTFPTTVLNFWAYYNTTNPQAVIEAGQSGLATNDGVILFKTMSGGTAPAERVRITSSGNMGIGISTPSDMLTLHRNGATIRLQTASDPEHYFGTITANYDATEPFTITSQGIRLTGVKALVGVEAQAYLSGYYGLALTTGSANPNSSNIRVYITQSGNVGIGTTTPTEKLSVNGTIRSKEVKVETANWPDYVFDEGYKVGRLEELESYIKANKHLPGIPSAKEVEKEGISLGEMNAKLLQKIEELTLHVIQLKKELDEVKSDKKK